MLDPFAIFYNDGSIAEGGGEDDEMVEVTFKVSRKFLEAPNDGIQAIVVYNPYSCRYVWRDSDHFFMLSGGEIHAADDIGPYLRKHLKGMMKFGLCLNREEYEDVFRKVKAYKNIPTECDRIPRPDDDLD